MHPLARASSHATSAKHFELLKTLSFDEYSTMRFRPIIFAWCLLFGATLAMAAAAWWLLGREADRVESLATGTLAKRTASVAENIDLLMEEIRNGVTEGLLTVSEVPNTRVALAELVEGNPYLASGYFFRGSDAVTVWFGDRGEFPPPGSLGLGEGSAKAYPWSLPEFEDDRIVERKREEPSYRDLVPQSKAPSDAYAPAPQKSSASLDADYGFADVANESLMRQEVVAQNVALKEQRAAVRKVNVDNRAGLSSIGRADEILEAESVAPLMASAAMEEGVLSDEVAVLAGEDFAVATEAKKKDEAQTPVRKGWARPTVDSQEQWMAWVGLPSDVDYVGAWLDREAIVAELSKAINLSQEDGLRFRLVDAEGRVVSGDYKTRYSSRSKTSPELSLAVGSALPLWRIETFRANGANAFGSSFRWVGGLFIAGLSFAILLGSTVLIWQARRDAREAQRKTTFVANVSHELKTPLTSIRLFADMLHDGRVKDETKQREYLQTMVNETQRLTRLVNNVLDFSRLDRGQRRVQKEVLDLNVSIAEMIETQCERLRGEGLEVSFQPSDSELHVEADSDTLEQILLNLLDNAAKYASSGKRAEVALASDASGWSLRVSDFGPGISSSERKKVFNAFHRSDDRLTSERPGCGLGLSIAARLAEEMGGQLTLEDNQPTGCSFILRLS